MTITFAVSKVERARARMPTPDGEGPDGPPRKLGGRAVEAWGSNTWPFRPAYSHGLLASVHAAYANHYPLVLTPDAIWLCIAQGFAAHVNANAERLRSKFVRHEGRAAIQIRRDDFVKGAPNNPWPEVFSAFSDAIAGHIGKQRDLVVCDFSTTGPVERAASEVALLDTFQRYFRYEFMTLCGIPEVTLEGTLEDWRSLRRRVSALEEYELSWWTKALHPVIDELIAAADGRPNTQFWEALFKEKDGSGGPYVSGWINVFFPYLRSDFGPDTIYRNNDGLSWARKGRDSMVQVSMIPSGLSTAPFVWSHLGESISMQFVAGFVGFAQDPETLALRPAIGWGVRETSEGDASMR